MEETVGGRMGPIPPLLVSELCDASHFLTTMGTVTVRVSVAVGRKRTAEIRTDDDDNENGNTDTDQDPHLHVLPACQRYAVSSRFAHDYGAGGGRTTTAKENKEISFMSYGHSPQQHDSPSAFGPCWHPS